MAGFEDFDFAAPFKAQQAVEPKAPGLLRSAADTSLSVARGAVQGTKMLSDAFGAGNPVSDTLQRGIDWLSNNFSDHSKWEQLTSAQDQRAAALSGETWEELKAAARSFGKRPVDFLAEAAGTSLPTIAAAFLPGGQGAVLGRVAMMSVGAAQGAGAVKGQIYDTVEEAWKQAGVAPEEARERAAAAQDYFGSNAGQIALGTALGALAGGTGVEAGVLGARAGAGAAAGAAADAAQGSIFARAAARTPQFLKDGLKEALPEGAQGGQEQLAGNLAMQNEGFATPTMQGVAGNAALEALAGGAFGAVASPLHRQQPRVSTSDQGLRELAAASNADEAINAALKAADVPLTGGLSAEQEARALTALDAQAKTDLDDVRNAGRAMTLEQQRASGAPPAPAPAPMPEPTLTDMPFADRVLVVREQVADAAVREQVREAFGPDALREVLRAASIADRPDINMPEATRERLLQLAEHILSRAQLRPLDASVRGPTATREPAGPGLQAPSSVPRIALDTEPTGTIRVNSMGTAAPEVRADAISTKQRVDAMRRRPDGFEQQVQGRPLPRDFTLVGEGTLTTPSRPAPATPRQIAMDTPLDERAHAAATSPTNDRPEPTQAQKEAGNYAKGHVRVGGLDISVENPAGSTRRGVDSDGKPWENSLQAHYGYIRRTTGADGEHVDVFVKPGTPQDYSGPVFVVDQVDPQTGKFDESKVMLGFSGMADAKAAYQRNYAADWQGGKSIRAMPMSAFKRWLADAEATRRPASDWRGNGRNEARAATRAFEAPAVQALAQREGSVQQPQEPVLPQLRGQGDQDVPGVAGQLPGVHGRNRSEAESAAHPGSQGERRSLRAGQRDLGDEARAGQQPAQKPSRDARRTDADDRRVGTGTGAGTIDGAQPAGSRKAGRTGADADQVPAGGALPVAKLAELVQLTGRDRGEVARQFAGVVRKQGRVKADEMLERALQVARARPKPEPAAAPAAQKPRAEAAPARAEPAAAPAPAAPSEGAVAQPAVAGQPSQPAPPTPSPGAAAPAREQRAAQRARLVGIAARLGIQVFEVRGGWHASSSAVEIPDGDVDAQSAVTPNHVFAHELGHAIMQKRGFSFRGFPKAEVVKRIANYDALIAASKAFRPGVHGHENERFRRHAMKPNEVLADAIASVLIGEQQVALIEPLMQATGMTVLDLGIESAPNAAAPAPQPQPEPKGEAATATEAAAPSPKKPGKPRMGESADELWRAIQDISGGVVSDGRVRYPTLRVVGGDDFRLDANNKLLVVDKKSGGMGVRDATDTEADEFHRDLDRDGVQVLILTAPGYGSAYRQQQVLQELHSPSGNSFGQQAKSKAAEPAAAPAAPPKESAATTGSADEVADQSGAERVALPGDRPAEPPVKRKTTLAAEVARAGKQRQRLNALHALRSCLNG